jgi:PKHD-type hydroxylase
MKYNWRLLSTSPKKLLKKQHTQLLAENNQFFLPQAIPNFLSGDECNKLLMLSQNLSRQSGTVGAIGVTSLRDSQIQWMFPDDEVEWLFIKLDRLATQVNQAYKFDLLGFFEGVQIATYAENGHYGWHVDVGKGKTSNRKLAISVQLSDSDDYQGGDLEFMCIPQKGPRERGTAIIFPAFLVHRVSPVTQGCRKSLVSWISGEPFR